MCKKDCCPLPSISYLPSSCQPPPPRQRSARRKNWAVIWKFHDLQIVILLAIAIIKIHIRELQQTCGLNDNLDEDTTMLIPQRMLCSFIKYEAVYTRLDSAKVRHYDVSSPQVSPPLRVHFNSHGSSLKIAVSKGGREGRRDPACTSAQFHHCTRAQGKCSPFLNYLDEGNLSQGLQELHEAVVII